MNVHSTANLKKEQEATLARPPKKYGLFTHMLFWGMDVVHGRATTLPKVKLLEILARIPYQAWEIREYGVLHSRFADDPAVKEARDVIAWGRAAQDNEFWHLRVITERMRKLGIRESWFHARVVTPAAVFKYRLFACLLARFNLKGAFQLNAEFEDHAEHAYMQFVKDHPELESEKVDSEAAAEYGQFESWADVFRRIALDERDHMNNSLIHCGRGSEVVP